MKKVYSGLSYFYNWDDNMQEITTLYVKLVEPVNCKLLEEAINDALVIHEHFKVRLAIKDNNVYYEYNSNKAKVLEGIDKEFSLIRDTEGYLFAFRAVNKIICIDIFHLLADGDGTLAFFKTVMLYYFSKVYADNVDWDRIFQERKERYQEAEKKADPYTLAEVIKTEIENGEREINQYLQIYEEEDATKFVCIKWNYEDYQKCSVGEFSPYIAVNVLLGNAIEESDCMAEPIGAYIPVNMRKRLELEDSMYNCLSYTNAEHVSKYDSKSLYEQCAEYADSLKQKYKQNDELFAIMKEDAKLIEIMQNKKISIERKCGMVRGISKRTQKMRGTFGMSYVRFCAEEEIFKKYMVELTVCAPNSGMGMMCEMIALGNDINLCMRYGKKQEEIVSRFVQSIKELNFNVEVREIEDVNTRISLDLLETMTS